MLVQDLGELIRKRRKELNITHRFLEKQTFVETLVSRSFLSEPNKRSYLLMYNTKRNFLIA